MEKNGFFHQQKARNFLLYGTCFENKNVGTTEEKTMPLRYLHKRGENKSYVLFEDGILKRRHQQGGKPNI